jgi:hypothetical protein
VKGVVRRAWEFISVLFSATTTRSRAALWLFGGSSDITAAGVTRQDVEADDVLMSLSGVAFAVGEPSHRAQAGRMLDLLMDGLPYKR